MVTFGQAMRLAAVVHTGSRPALVKDNSRSVDFASLHASIGSLNIQALFDRGYQGGGRRLESRSALQEHSQRRLAFASFQLAVVRAIHAGQESKCILRYAPGEPPLTQYRTARACDQWVERVRTRSGRARCRRDGGTGFDHLWRFFKQSQLGHGIYAVICRCDRRPVCMKGARLRPTAGA